MAVALKFELTDADVAAAVKISSRKTNNRFWIHLLCIGFLVLIIDFLLNGSGGAERVIMAVTTLLFLTVALAHFLNARALNRKRNDLGLLEYTFKQEEILFRDSRIECKVKWAYYRSFTETREHYLLFSSDSPTVIPKSAFTSDEQRKEFVQLLDKIRQSTPK